MIYKGKKYKIVNSRDTNYPNLTCPQCVFNEDKIACERTLELDVCDGEGDFMVKVKVNKHSRRVLNITKDVK